MKKVVIFQVCRRFTQWLVANLMVPGVGSGVGSVVNSDRQRGGLAGVVLAVSLLLGIIPAPTGANDLAEYELKAAFLLRLSEFVNWQVRDTKAETFSLCVAAPDATLKAFKQLNGRLIKGRPVEVVAKASVPEAETCALVFLGSKSSPYDGLVFDCSPSEGCLMVGETHQSVVEARAIIALVRQDDRIRIEINLDAAKKEGLQIDGDLLEVATIVETPS